MLCDTGVLYCNKWQFKVANSKKGDLTEPNNTVQNLYIPQGSDTLESHGNLMKSQPLGWRVIWRNAFSIYVKIPYFLRQMIDTRLIGKGETVRRQLLRLRRLIYRSTATTIIHKANWCSARIIPHWVARYIVGCTVPIRLTCSMMTCSFNRSVTLQVYVLTIMAFLGI